MKKIPLVQNDERLVQKGDLTIEGDVGNNAQIEIEDGSLIINGNLGSNVRITVKATEAFRNRLGGPLGLLGLGGRMVFSGGNVVFSRGGQSVSTYSSNGRVYKSVSANQSMNINGIQMYIGNVNINDRILTNGQVIERTNGNYEITVASKDILSVLTQPNKVPTESVEATIDGVRYCGRIIKVEGTTVYIDGQLAIAAQSIQPPAAEPEDTPLNPPILRIKGFIQDGTSIVSDIEIEASHIGLNCSITSEHAGLTAGNIGNATRVAVRNAIKVKQVGEGVRLYSSQYGINALNIGHRSTISVRDAVDVENIGNHCTITSQQYGIKAGDIGESTTVAVRDAINLRNVAASSVITSQQYGINAKNIADGVQIRVRDAIKLQCVGNNCKITTQQYGIEVEELVGNTCELIGRDDIIIGGLGDNSSCSSSHGKFKALGHAGNNIIVQARDSIYLKNIGDRAKVTCSHGNVSIRNIGVNAVVNAREEIDIDGTCPNPQSLVLQSNRNKIRRPTQAPQAVMQKHAVVESEEGQLLRAIRLSIQEQMPAKASAGGMFASSISKATTLHQIAIPKGFLCPLSSKVMDEPVLCILDGNSYEKSEITNYLKVNKASPMTEAPMRVRQSINEVLFPNHALQTNIEAFKIEYPELFIGKESVSHTL